MNASSHWIATRLAEPWEAPSFGAAGKLNKEARSGSRAQRCAARHGASFAGNPKSWALRANARPLAFRRGLRALTAATRALPGAGDAA